MSGAGPRKPRKFVGFFRFIDACERPGCPVCRCLADDARQYLDSLLYEQVNDPDTRRRLRAGWGFCSWHAGMLREVSDPAFGTAILYEDLLRVAIHRFEREAAHARMHAGGPLGWLRRPRRQASRSVLADLYRRRAVCPGCRLIAEAEKSYVEIALQFVDDQEFGQAYGQSSGLCVPHAVRALELGAGTVGAQQLLARTLPKWAELRRDLEGFIAKHDYRKRQPFTEAESTAYLRALEIVAGAPGLFGNDLGVGPRRRRRDGA